LLNHTESLKIGPDICGFNLALGNEKQFESPNTLTFQKHKERVPKHTVSSNNLMSSLKKSTDSSKERLKLELPYEPMSPINELSGSAKSPHQGKIKVFKEKYLPFINASSNKLKNDQNLLNSVLSRMLLDLEYVCPELENIFSDMRNILRDATGAVPCENEILHVEEKQTPPKNPQVVVKTNKITIPKLDLTKLCKFSDDDMK